MLVSSINKINKNEYNVQAHSTKQQKQQIAFGNGAETFIHLTQGVEVLGLFAITGMFINSLLKNHKIDKKEQMNLKEKAQVLINDINKRPLTEVAKEVNVSESALMTLKNMMDMGLNSKKVLNSAVKIIS